MNCPICGQASTKAIWDIEDDEDDDGNPIPGTPMYQMVVNYFGNNGEPLVEVDQYNCPAAHEFFVPTPKP